MPILHDVRYLAWGKKANIYMTCFLIPCVLFLLPEHFFETVYPHRGLVRFHVCISRIISIFIPINNINLKSLQCCIVVKNHIFFARDEKKERWIKKHVILIRYALLSTKIIFLFGSNLSVCFLFGYNRFRRAF